MDYYSYNYYNYYNYDDYLMHYGVKGMKWGHRKRYYDSNGNLNARGIKKYARAGYAQDAYNSNKSKLGKAYDKVTGAHKIGGDAIYGVSSAKANKARAEKYVADKEAAKAAKNTPEAIAARKQKQKTALKVGAAAAGTALAAYGAYKLNKYVKSKNYQIAAKNGHDYAERMFEGHLKALTSSPMKPSGATTWTTTLNANSGQRAKEAVDKASRDNFRTAAKNVVNYRKQNGRGSLRNIGTVDWYTSRPGSSITFGNR